MNIKNKYKDNYILLACLRQYVENGVMLALVNFYRDSVKNYPEFDEIKNRSEILKNNASFLSSNFLDHYLCITA